MTECKISVIIPVYKVENYLRRCLNSIVRQTYKNLEIILIDDGSPDNCGKICDEYAKGDERIKVVHKENGGVNTARNLGIQMASGEWIAFVDSDDWCDTDYFMKMVSYAKDSGADVFYAGGFYMEYDDRSATVSTIKSSFRIADAKKIDMLRCKVLIPAHEKPNVAFGYPWDKLYRAEFMHQNNLQFDTTLKAWDDMWTNFKIFEKARVIAGCTAIGYHYRQVTDSITKGYNPQKPEIMYQVISTFHDYTDHHELSDELHEAIIESAVSAIRTTLDCYFYHPENEKNKKQVDKELSEMLTLPYYHNAIYNPQNLYLSKKRIVFKCALRHVGILRLIYTANQRIRKVWSRLLKRYLVSN